jgi:hypothetical protein
MKLILKIAGVSLFMLVVTMALTAQSCISLPPSLAIRPPVPDGDAEARAQKEAGDRLWREEQEKAEAERKAKEEAQDAERAEKEAFISKIREETKVLGYNRVYLKNDGYNFSPFYRNSDDDDSMLMDFIDYVEAELILAGNLDKGKAQLDQLIERYQLDVTGKNSNLDTRAAFYELGWSVIADLENRGLIAKWPVSTGDFEKDAAIIQRELTSLGPIWTSLLNKYKITVTRKTVEWRIQYIEIAAELNPNSVSTAKEKADANAELKAKVNNLFSGTEAYLGVLYDGSRAVSNIENFKPSSDSINDMLQKYNNILEGYGDYDDFIEKWNGSGWSTWYGFNREYFWNIRAYLNAYRTLNKYGVLK